MGMDRDRDILSILRKIKAKENNPAVIVKIFLYLLPDTTGFIIKYFIRRRKKVFAVRAINIRHGLDSNIKPRWGQISRKGGKRKARRAYGCADAR